MVEKRPALLALYALAALAAAVGWERFSARRPLPALPAIVAPPPQAAKPSVVIPINAPAAAARSAPAPAGGAAEVPDAVPAPEPPEPDVAMGQRHVYGLVYDLLTLKPVGKAAVLFQNASEFALNTGVVPAKTMEFRAETDAQGHYMVDVPELASDGDLLVTITAEGYRPGALEDSEPPWRNRPLKERREKARQTAPSDLSTGRLGCPKSQTIFNFDFLVLPP